MSSTPARNAVRVLTGAAACLLIVAGSAQSAVHRRAHHSPPTKLHGLAAPSLTDPASGAHVSQIPTLTWSSVTGASEYEYQLAADPHFDSIVLGNGTGAGTARTHNLAAALSRSTADGTYYWRVRALTKTERPGP